MEGQIIFSEVIISSKIQNMTNGKVNERTDKNSMHEPLGNEDLHSKLCREKLRVIEAATLADIREAHRTTELLGKTWLRELEFTGAHPWDKMQPFCIMVDQLIEEGKPRKIKLRLN